MYDSHYGLTGRPFQLTPDSRFWFDTATHKKAMAYLGYGMSQGEGFIVITGDIGAGKTTLVGHLTDGIDADRLNVVKIVSTQIASDELLHVVCAGLDVDAASLNKAQMLGAIERGLHAVARGGRRTLLIVDEAQALPVDSLEELRMLSNFQSGGHALLQIFLLGQPEFREKLGDDGLEQLRQRVIAMHHLGPMDADELEPYLIHRLNVVGWTGRPDFTIDALDTIYAWSGGIPRRINQLVSRVLLHGAIEGIDTFTSDDVMSVITDLGGDGMMGGVVPSVDPQLNFDAPAPAPIVADAAEPDVVAESAVAQDLAIEEEPAVEDEPVAEDEPVFEEEARPIAADAPESDPMVMEWPFVATDAEPDADDGAMWRPITFDDSDDEPLPIQLEAPEVPEVPEVIEAYVPEPEVEPEAGPEAVLRPVEITAPPRLFEHVDPTGRGSMLAPVDPEPEADAPDPVEALTTAPDHSLERRVAEIEQRMEDQDAALRRVLTLLVDWVEGGSRPDFSSQDFAGQDFAGQDFAGQDFSGFRDKVG